MKTLLVKILSKLAFIKKVIDNRKFNKKVRLPKGVTEFNVWADDLIALSGAPDNDSSRFTLAAMILNLSESATVAPKRLFVDKLHKAMSNEIASGIMYQLKEKQKAEAQRQKELAASNEHQG